METRNYWEENGHVKYDNYNSNDGFTPVGASGELNFAAPASEDEAEFPPGVFLKKGKVSRQDPMSHRIIEKRRRDRMNNCLADLSRLIPPEYLKKGRGRVEKTEIIEMAIRHLKYLQDRVNVSAAHSDLKEAHVTGSRKREVASPGFCVVAAERQGEEFRSGYHEAVAETLRYLVDVHGYQPADGLCGQLAAHLHRHCDHITKAHAVIVRQKPRRSMTGSSSETASSSSGSLNYKPSVIASTLPPAPPLYPDNYGPEPEPEQPYQPMDCDRVPMNQMSATSEGDPINDEEPLPLLDGRRKREPTLRAVRKPEHIEDYLHSYKFKNSIERRFSRSQDFEASCPPENVSRRSHVSSDEQEFQQPFKAVEVGSNTIVCVQAANAIARNSTAHPHNKIYNHKRRRAAKPAPSTSTSNSGSTEEARDTSPQDTSSESPPHHHYEKPKTQSQFVPVFALNALGKYYVPLSVEYSCLSRLGPFDVLDARAAQLAAPLHPVTIHVNFQPCLNYHVKREPSEREWRPT